MAGFYTQQKTAGVTVPQKVFVWVGLFLTLLMGAVFILNQIQDRHSDSRNDKLFLIAHGHLTPKSAFIEAAGLVFISLGLAFAASLNMGLLFFLILLLTGYFYSFSPFNWKDRPILGLLSNALGALLIFIAGWLVQGSVSVHASVKSVPYVCAVAAVYLLTTLPDLKGDASTDKITFGVKYGIANTVYLSTGLVVLSSVFGYIFKDELIFYPAFFSLPFFIWAAVQLKMEDISRAIKYPILLLAMTISIKWRLTFSEYTFFLLLVGVYFFSKFYYKFRFGVDYPSLSTGSKASD
jgi:4-hydroxybenzoate polyprenyltransferase